MKYTIKEYTKYNHDEIMNLYTSVGWTNYTNNPDMLANAYKNSLKVFAAYENENCDGIDGKLLGVIRVVGDGYSIVYIQDILILPEYQHKGIGSALMKKVLDTYSNVYQKVLFTDNTEKTICFYKSMGFEMDTDINCRAFFKMF